MTILAILTVLAVLESNLPSCCLSDKIQEEEAIMMVSFATLAFGS